MPASKHKALVTKTSVHAPQAEEALQRIDNMSWRPRWLTRGALLSAAAVTFYSWYDLFRELYKSSFTSGLPSAMSDACWCFQQPWGLDDSMSSSRPPAVRGGSICVHPLGTSHLQVPDSVHTWQAGLQCSAPIHVLDPHPLLDCGTCVTHPVMWVLAGGELVCSVSGVQADWCTRLRFHSDVTVAQHHSRAAQLQSDFVRMAGLHHPGDLHRAGKRLALDWQSSLVRLVICVDHGSVTSGRCETCASFTRYFNSVLGFTHAQFHTWLHTGIPNGQPKLLLNLFLPGYPLMNFAVRAHL